MDKDLRDFLVNEICFEVSDYGIPPEEVSQSLEELYDDSLDVDANIQKISKTLLGIDNESPIDKEYYILEIGEKYPCDEMDYDDWRSLVEEAIDKTVNKYSKDGELLVENWSEFDKDLDDNVCNALDAYE